MFRPDGWSRESCTGKLRLIRRRGRRGGEFTICGLEGADYGNIIHMYDTTGAQAFTVQGQWRGGVIITSQFQHKRKPQIICEMRDMDREDFEV